MFKKKHSSKNRAAKNLALLLLVLICVPTVFGAIQWPCRAKVRDVPTGFRFLKFLRTEATGEDVWYVLTKEKKSYFMYRDNGHNGLSQFVYTGQ